MFIGSFWRLVLRRSVANEQGAEQQDHDPDANRRVGDIKDIKGPELAKMQVEEVDDIAEPHAIDDIAERAAEHEPEREPVAGLVLAPDPLRHADRDRRGHGDQQPAVGIVLRLGKPEADPEILAPR